MKKTIMCVGLILCLLLGTLALAEATLNVDIENGDCVVRWSGIAADGGTLTVYVDGWPAAVCRVKGPSSEKRLRLDKPGVTCSARLVTSSGCVSSGIEQPSKETATTSKPAATPAPKPTATPVAGTTQSGLAAEVVRQVNAERRKAGLSELSVSVELTRAAAVRAREIVQKFSHTRPDGSAWSTVSGAAYGENIAMGQRTADKVMAAWMSSSGHRANILRPSFGSIGVCAYVSGGVTYWVQLFGR